LNIGCLGFQFFSGMKRKANFGGVLPSKVQVTSEPPSTPPEGQGENWTCKECGNENWPRRTTCNRCKAPGPWTCPACSNKNFQGRDFCNRKRCNQPRPGLQPMMMPGMMMPQPMMSPMMMQAGGSNPPGSWQCSKCQNINWPKRTTCKKCEIPRDQGDPAYLKMCAATGENPAGSWVCTQCENVNWPKRTTCKKCGTSREQVDGGAPPPSSKPPRANGIGVPSHQGRPILGTVQPGAHPAGSWSCSSCNNVNWPMRTTCKKCGISKDEGDASWTCPSCGNVNWPLRTTCNNKSCLAPKPT